MPLAAFIAGEPVDLSALGETGDTRGFLMLFAEALTISAFGEEMVFRGYLMRRITDLVGDTSVGRVLAVAVSGVLFGLAHRYQGWAGVIATGTIGAALATLYLSVRRNLWVVVLSHGIVDAVLLSALYLGHASVFLP